MQVFWFIPTHGDGRYLGTSDGGRLANLPYLTSIAQAADNLGYAGVLLPTGTACEDSWLVASALVPATKRLRFLVALRPGLMSPTLSARMTATLDQLSDGRLLINVVTGGDPVEMAADGVHLSHAERYEITDEYLDIWQRELAGETVTHHGKHLTIDGAKLLTLPVQRPRPPVFFGGSSEAGQRIAAKYVDKYLTWGEPPAQVAEKIANVRAFAAEAGRQMTFGIRLHVIVRETEEEAWAAADQLISKVDDATIAKAQAVYARMDSVGQERMRALHNGSRGNLVVAPNLWAGVGLVRGGAGTALVGTPDQVAERMNEYAEIGIDTFILSGYPHLEEAYRFAELMFPRLQLEGTGEGGPLESRVFSASGGEVVANAARPELARASAG